MGQKENRSMNNRTIQRSKTNRSFNCFLYFQPNQGEKETDGEQRVEPEQMGESDTSQIKPNKSEDPKGPKRKPEIETETNTRPKRNCTKLARYAD